MVQKAVEQADGGGVLGQELAPLYEGPVARDRQVAPFVGRGEEPEQQLAAGAVERDEPDLDDDEVVAQDGLDEPSDAVVGWQSSVSVKRVKPVRCCLRAFA